MQYGLATTMGSMYAEFYSLSTDVAGLFFRALKQKLLTQTTKCGQLSWMG